MAGSSRLMWNNGDEMNKHDFAFIMQDIRTQRLIKMQHTFTTQPYHYLLGIKQRGGWGGHPPKRKRKRKKNEDEKEEETV